MPDIRLTAEEQAALRGSPIYCRWLYVEIRARMDFSTGLVGSRKGAGVSWRTFQEAMYVEPEQGVKTSGTPAKSMVRRAAERLERMGLIAIESKPKKLIIRCLLSYTDFSASNKPGTNPAQTRHMQTGTPEISESISGTVVYMDKENRPGTNPARETLQNPGTPPVSGTEGSSREVEGNIPRARVDHRPLMRALIDLGKKHRRLAIDSGSVSKPRVVQKLRQWTEQGLTASELSDIVTDTLSNRPDSSSLSPAYFFPIVADWLAVESSARPQEQRFGNEDMAQQMAEREAELQRKETDARRGTARDAEDRARGRDNINGIPRLAGELLHDYMLRVGREAP